MSKKIPISEYVKKIRKETGLNIEQFANKIGVSRAYVSRLENKALDEKMSIALLNKMFTVYDMTFDDLYEMDIPEIFVEGVGFLHLKDPYASGKNINKNLNNLKEYLEKEGYTNIRITRNGKDEPYDMIGITPDDNKFVCKMMQVFSTSINDIKRKNIIFNKTFSLIQDAAKREIFRDDKKLELIIFTSSDTTFETFENYKKEHIKNKITMCFSLKVIYLFQNRKPQELVIF